MNLRPPTVNLLRTRLLSWYAKEKRDLPWRRNRDPYRIWISEIMLQQTRVATVLPRYREFLRCFPSIQALSRASEKDVLTAWSGLGYYSRARNLHAAARAIVSCHRGRFPTRDEEIAALPGVGPYTAGAIASIAFDRSTPAVDGNVIRVLSRVHSLEGDAKSLRLRSEVTGLASRLVAAGRASEVNQGLMDLGATICLPRSPLCESCPIAAQCLAYRTGRQELIPAARSAAPTRPRRVLMLLLQKGGATLVLTPRAGLFRGLALFPSFELSNGELPVPRASKELRNRGMKRAGQVQLLGSFRHSVLSNRLEVVAALARIQPSDEGDARSRDNALWPHLLENRTMDRGRFVAIRGLRSSPLPSLSRKALDRAGW